MIQFKPLVGLFVLAGLLSGVSGCSDGDIAGHGHSHGPSVTSKESAKSHDSLTNEKEEVESHGHSH